MVSSMDGLEALVRVLGLEYVKEAGSILVSYETGAGRTGIVLSIDEAGWLRIAIPTDVEPTVEGLRWLLAENFSNTGYKYSLDYDGFITVVVDVPARCVGNARELRELMLYAVEGYRRLMERVSEGKEED